jgi:hypothetical protein
MSKAKRQSTKSLKAKTTRRAVRSPGRWLKCGVGHANAAVAVSDMSAWAMSDPCKRIIKHQAVGVPVLVLGTAAEEEAHD